MARTQKNIKHFEYNCVHLIQGTHKLITFSAPASELWQILSINRRVEDKDEGYQRTLSMARVRDIAKYIQSGNPVPLSILITGLSPKFFKRIQLQKGIGVAPSFVA